MSGAIATEYAAHVAEMPTATRIPARSPEKSPPEPAATTPTPPNETPAASQKRPVMRSTPASDPKSAGEHRHRAENEATVVAVVSFSA